MKSFILLWVFALFMICASATIITIPLKKIQRTGAYLQGSPGAARVRAALLKTHAFSGPVSVPATDMKYVQYTMSVGIGNPPRYYNLIIDTGSSSTFCGTGAAYVRTVSSISTGQEVDITFGSGVISGDEYLDQVTVAPDPVIKNQSIGDATFSTDFEGVDGLIGFGPVGLTNGTLSPDSNVTVPTVMNNLISQNLIGNEVLGIYFAPSTKSSDTNGALAFGGADPSLYEGELTYTPLTRILPSAYYWGIDITSCTYNTRTIISSSSAGIVDTGNKQVLLADDLFDVYASGIPGAKWDMDTDLIEIPSSSVSSMKFLNFTIGGNVFSLDIVAQLIPQDENKAWGGVAGKRYGVVGRMGSPSGEGMDFILGQAFMERYYTVFDTNAGQIGFAQT